MSTSFCGMLEVLEAVYVMDRYWQIGAHEACKSLKSVAKMGQQLQVWPMPRRAGRLRLVWLLPAVRPVGVDEEAGSAA